MYSEYSKNSENNDALKELLTIWKSEILFNILREHGFSCESLKYVTGAHLDTIIPKSLFGARIIFEYHLKNWQKEQDIAVDEETPTSSSHSGSTLSVTSSFSDLVNFNNVSINGKLEKRIICEIEDQFSLSRILKTSSRSANILTYFNKNKKLSPKYRGELVTVIATNLCQLKHTLTPTAIEQISEEIVKHFPSENKKIYFSRRKNKKASGILYNKYHNLLYNLRKEGILAKANKTYQPDSTQPELKQ